LVLNRAAALRQANTLSPDLITPGMVYLSLVCQDDLKALAQKFQIDHYEIGRWAYNANLLANFTPYDHPLWQRDVWDQHVDRAIDGAYIKAQQIGIETAPSGILLPEVINTDPIQDIVMGRGIGIKLERFGQAAYQAVLDGTSNPLNRAG
jgi:hypothetical protein